MSHPNQATLALHAGGDLGKFARWKVERHLAKCDTCAAEVAAYEGVREAMGELSDLPDLPWNQMAAEMKANIRLGLAAGECVGGVETPLRDSHWFTGMRAAVACAGIVALICTGIILERPRPQEQAPVDAKAAFTPMIETIDNGIQSTSGGGAMGLMNHGANNTESVNYLPNAGGRITASYINASGYVTVNTVYGSQ